MSFARAFYERFRSLIHEAASFGVVGAIGFVVTTGGSNLLHFNAGVGPLKSNIIATVAATIVTYVGNRYWSFRRRERTGVPREAIIFFVLNGVGILIQLVSIGFTYYLLGLHGKLAYNIALVFGIALGTLFRFWSYRKWVWAAPAAPQAAPAAHHMSPPGGPSPWSGSEYAGDGEAGPAPDLLPVNGHRARGPRVWTGSRPLDQ